MKSILEDIKTQNFKQAYLLYGEEAYLKHQYKNKLKNALLPEDDTMNFSRFEGKGTEIPKVIDLAETMPFFADRRVILLENTGFFKNKADALADYMGSLPDYLVLIFVEEEVDKREIAILTTRFLNNSHFAAMMLDRFQSELQHLHACMTIHRISPAELAAKELPPSLNTEHTAGIICFEVFDYDYAQMLCTLGIPLLFVDTPVMEMRPPLQADRLYMENRIEIQNMVAQMAQRGRKRIAFAGDKEHCQSFHERYRAYKDAAEHFGMATDWPTCATQKTQPNYSEYLYQSLRGCPTMPDAFICTNDFIAMDLINALHRLGYSVPDDIWICGFDDSQEASYFSPRLTSIHIHGQIMGYAAANLLMTRIEEPSLNYRTVYTETNLILRESTGD